MGDDVAGPRTLFVASKSNAEMLHLEGLEALLGRSGGLSRSFGLSLQKDLFRESSSWERLAA